MANDGSWDLFAVEINGIESDFVDDDDSLEDDDVGNVDDDDDPDDTSCCGC
ncbi:MAG: hypothetical protein M5R36_23365 [Deltaproteobacteria bacterium]|nr:hypothetical protein [Deltaproteobacteria bacterium]